MCTGPSLHCGHGWLSCSAGGTVLFSFKSTVEDIQVIVITHPSVCWDITVFTEANIRYHSIIQTIVCRPENVQFNTIQYNPSMHTTDPLRHYSTFVTSSQQV